MMKKRGFIKWMCLALFLAGGVYVVAEVPAAVESFLPTINTVGIEKNPYQETVKGSGYIYKPEFAGGVPDTDEWYVMVAINESDIRSIEVGQTATLSGAAFDDDVYTAAVKHIAETARQNTSKGYLETVVDVTLLIDNPDESLRSGYSVQTEIKVGEVKEICLVPYEVICQDENSEYVYVLKGNTAVRQDIITGAEFPNGAELLYGLRETDEVITSPNTITNLELVKKAETQK